MRSLITSLGLDADSAPFEPRLVTARVVSASPDVALLRHTLPDGEAGDELVMPVTEWVPGRRWAVGDSYQVLQLDAGPRALVSGSRPELVEALFSGVSPEVRAGAVRIMGVARAAGERTKVAVAATEANVDPIASCVGRKANRVLYVSSALLGERIDVVAWHPDREVYLRNALAPAGVSTITFEGDRATAAAPAHQMSAAVGGHGLNSQLAGQLVGVSVTIVPE